MNVCEIRTLAKELQEYTRVVGSHNKHIQSVANRLVELTEQSQLNECQQIAINKAKKSFEKGSDLYDCAIDMMLYDGLTDKEWAKATVAFLLWAQKREEE
ncbi:hypothetical protein [Enterococcus gallinarum]|uniref:Uncharacterized protein n=1 Tax=Enterococcus gallinarum TaxID=1353 RepID=A0A6I4XCI4_ENTGA|nr:hypothetical protein [Enterococcus gallinarum]MXS25267.1 hypothetical protein [Enterococcus gallinarum]DAG74606.1 MAG TPA: hypothetical protein [Caudoviricetes sp.]